MATVKTKHWICPKCARALTYDFVDYKCSRMDTVRASQELMKMKIRHKQLGCIADNKNQRRSFCLIATCSGLQSKTVRTAINVIFGPDYLQL